MKTFIGKPVVSLSAGVRVGMVKDVLLDTSALVAVGLVLKGDPGEGILPLTAIISNGDDAITIENDSAIKWASGPTSDNQRRTIDQIMRLSVVNSQGTIVGQPHNMVINPDGSIDCLEVTRGGVFGIGAHTTEVSPTQIHAIGPTMITVDMDVQTPVL